MLVSDTVGSAAEKQIELRWNELGAFLVGGDCLDGSDAVLFVAGGAVVRGKIAAVEDDDLVLNVSKSSDNGAYRFQARHALKTSVNPAWLVQMRPKLD